MTDRQLLIGWAKRHCRDARSGVIQWQNARLLTESLWVRIPPPELHARCDTARWPSPAGALRLAAPSLVVKPPAASVSAVAKSARGDWHRAASDA